MESPATSPEPALRLEPTEELEDTEEDLTVTEELPLRPATVSFFFPSLPLSSLPTFFFDFFAFERKLRNEFPFHDDDSN